MEQKELTSVEHIENAIKKYMAYYHGHYKAELFTIIDLNEAVEEAKEMHKQQILNAFRNGYILEDIKLADDYYVETFGKDN